MIHRAVSRRRSGGAMHPSIVPQPIPSARPPAGGEGDHRGVRDHPDHPCILQILMQTKYLPL